MESTPPSNSTSSQLHHLVNRWLQTESDIAVSGIPSRNRPQDPDEALTVALLQDRDAKKAEAIAIHSQTHPIQILRTLIQRGHIDEARPLLEKIRSNIPSSESLAIIELLHEEARILGLNGEYSRALEICNETIKLNPPSVTLIALLQIRAFLFFELGEFKRSLSDVDMMESLARLFPHAPTLLYGRILAIKAMARLRGVSVARLETNRLWTNTSHNADSVLTLLRLEIDLRRLEQKDVDDLALATHRIAEKMGDRLYSGWAFLDFYLSKNENSREQDQSHLTSILSEFSSIQNFWDNLENPGHQKSTTLKTILAHKPRHRNPWPDFDFQEIVLSGKDLIVRLSGDFVSVVPLPRRKQLFKAVHHIIPGELTKSEFFAKQWGRCRYVPRLHDGLIRTLICRIRKEMGLRIGSRDGVLKMEPTLLISL